MNDERKRIERLEQGIRKCREYKRRIERFSSGLSRDYKKGKIDHTKYEESMQRYLLGIDPEQWIDYYEEKSRELGSEIKKIASSGADAYKNNTRTVAICGFLLFMLVGMLIGNYARITGFASFEDTEVFAGKDTYNIGDMVHIFVVPGDAERTVEVYDSDNNMIAVSEDFPAERSGTYTIKASVKAGEYAKDVSATFSVASFPEDQGSGQSETLNDSSETPSDESGMPAPDENINIPEMPVGTEIQSASGVEGDLRDNEGNIVGKKIEDEKDYETSFIFIGRSEDYFLIVFYHNSTTAQPVWVEAEGEMLYNLSTLAAQPYENVTLAIPIPLDSQIELPKFRLHIGIESEVFEFDINGISGEEYNENSYVPEASDIGSLNYAGSGTVIDKEINFSKDDMVEESALDESKNPIAVTRIEKDGIKIDVRGAGKDRIKNVQFSNRILHVDSIEIKDAEISIPHEPLSGVFIAPQLYIKEDNETEFRLAEPYEKNGNWYEKIEVTSVDYVFNVEHFTSYSINTTGGFETLASCLKYINNSANTCVINEAGYYDINLWQINASISILNKSGLVRAFDFDTNYTSDNKTYDASDSHIDATVNNSLWNTTGYYGGAYEFNMSGTGGFVNMGDVDINASVDGATYMAWIKPNTVDTANKEIIGKGTAVLVFEMGIQGSGSVDCMIANKSGTTGQCWMYVASSLTDRNWHNAVCMYNRTGDAIGEIILYIDAIRKGSRNCTGENNLNNAGLVIGALDVSYNRLFNGTIDQARVWNRSLSLLEIQQMYAGDVQRYNITPSGLNPAIKISAANTTINCNDSIIEGNSTGGVGVSIEADNSTVQNCDLRNFTYGIAVSSNFSNITGNSIWYSAIYDLNLTVKSSSTNTWLNSFYSKGVNDTNFTNIFCIGNEGNFYAEDVPTTLIGNGTGANGTDIGGDCGPTNIVYPPNATLLTKYDNTTLNVSWIRQSSQNSLNYSIYLVNLSGRFYMNRTSSLSTIINFSLIKEDNYTLQVAPFDGTYNGTNRNISIRINNTLPTNVSLTNPSNSNTTVFNRTPFFNWTAAIDADWDTLTYTINITHKTCPDILVAGIEGTNYTPAYDLCVDSLYNWTVTAYDGKGYGNATDKWNFTIASSVILNMSTNASAFGNAEINQEYNTSYAGAPADPLVVQNDGNVLVDVNVSSNESLWQNVGLNTEYYQFKVNNRTTEAGSFNWTNSTTIWTNITDSNVLNVSAIRTLNYTDNNDTAEIDIRIKVPPDEPSGFKHSTLIITGAMSS